MKPTHRGETPFNESQKVGQRELFCTVVIEQGICAGGQPVGVLPRVLIHAIVVHDEAHDLDVFPNGPLGDGQGKVAVAQPPFGFGHAHP